MSSRSELKAADSYAIMLWSIVLRKIAIFCVIVANVVLTDILLTQTVNDLYCLVFFFFKQSVRLFTNAVCKTAYRGRVY